MAEWNYIEWAEQAANENLRHRLATGDLLLAQAQALLTLLLVGIGGACTYAVGLWDQGKTVPLFWGAAFTVVWLTLVGVAVMLGCIVTRLTDVLGNEPDYMYFPDKSERITEAEARGFSLQSMQRRITNTKLRNSAVACWLDRCRYATLATPAWFVVVVAFAQRWA